MGRGSPESALTRTNRCGSCQQIEHLWMKSFTFYSCGYIFTPIRSLAHWFSHPRAYKSLETPMKLQSLSSCFISLFFLIPSDFPCFHFEFDYAFKTLVILYLAYL